MKADFLINYLGYQESVEVKPVGEAAKVLAEVSGRTIEELDVSIEELEDSIGPGASIGKYLIFNSDSVDEIGEKVYESTEMMDNARFRIRYHLKLSSFDITKKRIGSFIVLHELGHAILHGICPDRNKEELDRQERRAMNELLLESKVSLIDMFNGIKDEHIKVLLQRRMDFIRYFRMESMEKEADRFATNKLKELIDKEVI